MIKPFNNFWQQIPQKKKTKKLNFTYTTYYKVQTEITGYIKGKGIWGWKNTRPLYLSAKVLFGMRNSNMNTIYAKQHQIRL